MKYENSFRHSIERLCPVWCKAPIRKRSYGAECLYIQALREPAARICHIGIKNATKYDQVDRELSCPLIEAARSRLAYGGAL
jgi:hypothetical protein